MIIRPLDSGEEEAVAKLAHARFARDRIHSGSACAAEKFDEAVFGLELFSGPLNFF
jgi:hypothetical protein